MEKLDNEDLNRFLAEDKINSLKEINEELRKKKNCINGFLNDNNINIYSGDNCIHFIFLKCNVYTEIENFLKIYHHLKVKFYAGNKIINNFFLF